MSALRILTLLAMLALSAIATAAQTPVPSPSPTPRQTSRQPNKPRNEEATPNRAPALTLEVGAVTQLVAGVKRASAETACPGDHVVLRANIADPNSPPNSYSWISTGGKIVGEGPQVVLDTTGLAPGTYYVTAAASYRGIGACNGDCTAYDSKAIRVSECLPLIVCFTSPVITLTPERRTVQPGEVVNFTASEVSGGQGYGKLTYTWKSSGGEIVGHGTTARLDTTGVIPGGVIEVGVSVQSEFANCFASGSAHVVMAMPPPPPSSRELPPCVTFKANGSRVDNACKYVLGDAARAMQTDARARLVVDAFRAPGESETTAFERGKNVRDRLVDGSIGLTVDANRIIVRVGGVMPDGRQVRLTFVPSGAAIPNGPPEAQLGPVEAEKKAAPHRAPTKAKTKKTSPR